MKIIENKAPKHKTQITISNVFMKSLPFSKSKISIVTNVEDKNNTKNK